MMLIIHATVSQVFPYLDYFFLIWIIFSQLKGVLFDGESKVMGKSKVSI